MDDATLPLPPPREIPRQVRWRTYLGGSAMTVGWGFLAAASLVFWTDGGREGIYSLVHLGGEVARAEARIVSKVETGSKSHSRTVYAYRYVFEADGRVRQGAVATHRAAWRVDERIRVEYARDDPARSLPADLPRRPTSMAALLAAIALLTMGLGFVPARNALDRLRHAPAARAADDERDGDDSDDRWLAFDVDGQRRRVRTNLAVRKHPRPIVLYRRETPGDGVAMLDLPGAPDTGGRGELREDAAALARCLLLPAIVAAGNAYSFWAAVR